MKLPPIVRRIGRPVVLILATLYFVLDAFVFALIGRIAARLARLPVYARMAAWIGRLGPYTSLALFLVPIVILEPVKPVGLYLLGTGRVVEGVVVIGIGELLKVALVEHLYHLCRDKLMTIPAFAWGNGLAVRWLGFVRALPPVRAARRAAARLKEIARALHADFRR